VCDPDTSANIFDMTSSQTYIKNIRNVLCIQYVIDCVKSIFSLIIPEYITLYNICQK